MPRRNAPKRFPTQPDTRYNSLIIGMFINRMMYGGKKSTAIRVMYGAMDIVADRSKSEPMAMLEKALNNIMPTVEVKPRRVGGSTYQVPIEVERPRGESLALRWLLAAARARNGRSMSERIAAEILDAANNQGAAVKRKEETHRMAEANRAFAHYRW